MVAGWEQTPFFVFEGSKHESDFFYSVEFQKYISVPSLNKQLLCCTEKAALLELTFWGKTERTDVGVVSNACCGAKFFKNEKINDTALKGSWLHILKCTMSHEMNLEVTRCVVLRSKNQEGFDDIYMEGSQSFSSSNNINTQKHAPACFPFGRYFGKYVRVPEYDLNRNTSSWFCSCRHHVYHHLLLRSSAFYQAR